MRLPADQIATEGRRIADDFRTGPGYAAWQSLHDTRRKGPIMLQELPLDPVAHFRLRAEETVSLSGKVALVTGSTSGIGLGIARALAAAGANVVLNGFGDQTQIDELVAEFRSRFKVTAGYSAADMSKPIEIAWMVAQVARELGGVDILVNNAGIQHVAPVEEFPVEKWDAVIAINLSAAFHAIRAALPHMKAHKWGRIINIASTHGLVASVQKAAYVAAKHGILGLTKVVALETATTGITCNAICPGWVLTPLVQKQIDALAVRERLSPDAARLKLLGEKQPSLEFATPGEIGATALFLCSQAAAQIRGIALPVDGGWTAQ
jgi:3-hydroxybutyrate dehydrogenase